MTHTHPSSPHRLGVFWKFGKRHLVFGGYEDEKSWESSSWLWSSEYQVFLFFIFFYFFFFFWGGGFLSIFFIYCLLFSIVTLNLWTRFFFRFFFNFLLAAKAALDFTLFVCGFVCLFVCGLVTLFWHSVKNDLHFVTLSLWR